MSVAALTGMRVVELATGVAGPFCARLLAEYGAEVIKVEPLGVGDPARRVGPFAGGVEHPEKGALFLHLNVDKKGVAINLEGAEGRALLADLVRHSQVVVESGPPGSLDNLGLSYDALRERQPALVLTSITPFGQTGPYKDHEFTELTIFATGGGMLREGVPEREPLKYGAQVAQCFAGAVAATATVAAALRALLRGQGDWIDLSIQECLAAHAHQVGRRGPFAYSGQVDYRVPPHTPILGRTSYGSGTFRCKDGHVSMLSLGARSWPALARMIGHPELLDDPRFATVESREDNKAAFTALFQPWLEAHTRREVFQTAHEAAIPAAPVLGVDEVMANEQFRDRGFFAEVAHPDAGVFRYPGLPFGMSSCAEEPRKPAPRLGQHTDEVLKGVLGLDDAALRALRRRGVV